MHINVILHLYGIRPDELFELFPLACHICGAPAACLGNYADDRGEGDTFACDDCCGHGNEDGYCSPVRA